MMPPSRSGLMRLGLRTAGILWPLVVVWYAWTLSDAQWLAYLARSPRIPLLTASQLLRLTPIVDLAGPALVMAALVALHRVGPASRGLALLGVTGFAAITVLTGWPECWLLWPYVGDPRNTTIAVLIRGSSPLRCGRAIYFRRPEWANLAGINRFHMNAAE